MKKLPKYALLYGEGFIGAKVMQLERPYIIASVYDFKRDDYEHISEMQEIKLNEREPIAKVKGYTIWLRPLSSLEPNNDFYYTQDILEEMADYFLKTRIANKPGVYMKSQESGAAEKRIVSTGRIMRERKNKVNKD